MISNILFSIGQAIAACFEWSNQLITSTGTFNLIIGVFTLIVMTRLLIVPIIGGKLSPGSDRVRKQKSKDDE